MEEYLEGEGSLEGGFLCMDGDGRKNPHVGQFTEKECYGGVVLYV